MDRFLVILPFLILAVFCAVALYISLGRKYSVKKTLLISIPLVLAVLAANVIIYMNVGLDANAPEPLKKLENDIAFWFSLSFYAPIALIMFLVGEAKPICFVAIGLNIFLGYYFIYLAGVAINIQFKSDYDEYIWYVLAFPLAILFLRLIYNKLLKMLNDILPKYNYVLAIYALIMIVSIFAFSELVKLSSDAGKLRLFGIVIPTIYIASIFIIYFIIIKYHETYEENNNLILMKGQVQSIQDQYKLREKKDEEVKILRHDMKHILITLSSLIKNDKPEEALDFINNYVTTIDSTKTKNYCNDSIINSILEYYCSKAEDEDVILNIKVNNIEDALNVPPYETAVLISNCLDNAIKAANKLKNNRIVDFKFWNNDGRLILQCKNNYDGIILIDKDGRPTNLAKGHGLGSDSIELFAKKYNLNITYEITENIYKINIIF